MRPIFDCGLRVRLHRREGGRPVFRHARPEDVVMAALDDADRVDLDIAEMAYCRGDRRGSAPKEAPSSSRWARSHKRRAWA